MMDLSNSLKQGILLLEDPIDKVSSPRGCPPQRFLKGFFVYVFRSGIVITLY